MRPRKSHLLLGVLAILAAALFVRLGLWQLDRLDHRQTRNEARRARLALAPLELEPGALLPAADSVAWRRVILTGRYDFERELVVRGRAYRGTPGAELLTPVRLGDAGVLVHRGWLPAPDGYRPDLTLGRPAASGDPDPVRVEGIALPDPGSGGAGVPTTYVVAGKEHVVVSRIDLGVAQEALPYALAPFYVRATRPGVTGASLQPLADLDLSDGPHLGYAIQWFAFAFIAIGGAAVLILRGGRSAAWGQAQRA
jgi:surfeit locus 1 family protein